MVQPAQSDKAIDMGQGGGPVKQGQATLPGRLPGEEEQLAVAQGKQPGFLLHVQNGAIKEEFAGDQQCLLPHRLPVMGQTLQKQPQQLPPPVFIGLPFLGEDMGQFKQAWC